VWGVGHSFGGVLHLHAALRCPHLYRGVVMLDSPVLTRADQWVIRAAKRFGFIDRLTPAGRTLGGVKSSPTWTRRAATLPARPCFAASIRNASMPTCNMVAEGGRQAAPALRPGHRNQYLPWRAAHQPWPNAQLKVPLAVVRGHKAGW
jgi:pimeloyl-ACP methyl ester carboxylesterase